jgi:serine/threonine-protein kinase
MEFVVEATEPWIRELQLGRLLGKGGQSEIYYAEHPERGVPLAVKVIREIDFLDRFERFRLEFACLNRLHHPSVVAPYGIGTSTLQDDDAPLPSLVMEFAGDYNLKQRVNYSPLLVREAVLYAIHLGRALDYVHSQREPVIHRDVNPKNVMVDKDNIIRLVDFGLVKPSAGVIKEDSNMMAGTSHYVSPEQIADAASVDHRTDIYGAGMTLFFMLTNSTMFSDRLSIGETIRKYSESPHTPPSRFNDAVTKGLDEVVLTAVEQDRDKRFPSARAFVGALREVYLGELVRNGKDEALVYEG